MDPIAINLGTEATRRLANSAMPDAPRLPDPPREPDGGGRHGPGLVRRIAASGLRRLADRLEPRPLYDSST
jgi:hypothetical protein